MHLLNSIHRGNVDSSQPHCSPADLLPQRMTRSFWQGGYCSPGGNETPLWRKRALPTDKPKDQERMQFGIRVEVLTDAIFKSL